MQLEQSIQLIQQGAEILKSWKDLYHKTKSQIEEDNLDRWDFTVRTIGDRIEYMANKLDELKRVIEILRRFLVFLGPNLKKVTGNSSNIDERVQDVKQLVTPIITSPYNFFQK